MRVDTNTTDEDSIIAVYEGKIIDHSFQIRIVNPMPGISYTHQHNPYPDDPSNWMSYYTLNVQKN